MLAYGRKMDRMISFESDNDELVEIQSHWQPWIRPCFDNIHPCLQSPLRKSIIALNQKQKSSFLLEMAHIF